MSIRLQFSRLLACGGVLLVAGGCGRVTVHDRDRLQQPVVGAEPRVVRFDVPDTVVPSLTPAVERGLAVYTKPIASPQGDRSCASCHGADGQPAQRGLPDFTTAGWKRDASPLEHRQRLLAHEGFDYANTLSLQEQWDVLAFVRHLSVTKEWQAYGQNAIFGRNCNVCHGNHGYGIGILSHTMQPQPRNVTDFRWGALRTDQEIWENIWHGVHWSAMPPWRGALSEDDVWAAVDFIRSVQYVMPEQAEADSDGAAAPATPAPQPPAPAKDDADGTTKPSARSGQQGE